MGSTMEAGKLLTTLILHQYWDRLSIMLRMYLTTAVVLLMLVTSGGVYGFLSAAYQKDQVPLQQLNAKMELVDVEYARKTERLEQMNATTASIGANYISARVKEKEFDKIERDALTARINELELQKMDLASKKIDTEAHIGPIIYMAEVFNSSAGQAANFLIILLIVVFDPLAIALTITVSTMIRIRQEDKEAQQQDYVTDAQLSEAIDHEVQLREESTKTLQVAIDSIPTEFKHPSDPLEFTRHKTDDDSIEASMQRFYDNKVEPEGIDVESIVQRVIDAQDKPEPIIIEKEVIVEKEVEVEREPPTEPKQTNSRSQLMKQVRENSSK